MSLIIPVLRILSVQTFAYSENLLMLVVALGIGVAYFDRNLPVLYPIFLGVVHIYVYLGCWGLLIFNRKLTGEDGKARVLNGVFLRVLGAGLVSEAVSFFIVFFTIPSIRYTWWVEIGDTGRLLYFLVVFGPTICLPLWVNTKIPRLKEQIRAS